MSQEPHQDDGAHNAKIDIRDKTTKGERTKTADQYDGGEDERRTVCAISSQLACPHVGADESWSTYVWYHHDACRHSSPRHFRCRCFSNEVKTAPPITSGIPVSTHEPKAHHPNHNQKNTIKINATEIDEQTTQRHKGSYSDRYYPCR